MADKITIEIGVTGNARVEVKNLTKEIETFGTTAQKSFFNLDNAFSVFAGNLASNAIGVAFTIFKDAAREFFSVLEIGIKAAQEQEVAISDLNQALLSSGALTTNASKKFQEFATSIQNSTTFSDDAVLSAGALLENLSNLSENGLEKATKAAIELAAKFNIDLQSAAVAVGKAAEGMSFKVRGFKFTADETKSSSENLALAIKKIGDSGAAASKLDTFEGSVKQLKNQFGELLETLGNLVIKNPVVIETIKQLSLIVQQLNEGFSNNGKGITEFINKLSIDLTQAVVFAIPIIKFLGIAALEVAKDFEFAQTVISQFTNVVTLGLTDAGKRAGESKAKFEELDKTIETFRNADAFDTVTASLNKLVEAQKAAAAAPPPPAAGTDPTDVQANAENASRIKDEQAARDLEREQAKNEKIVTMLQEENSNLEKIDGIAYKERIDQNNQFIKALESNHGVSDKKLQKDEADAAEKSRAITKLKYQQATDILNNFAVLQQAKTKEIQVIGKAAAIASTTINTYQAASLALATIPPPFGFIAAAANIAAGLIQVSNIAGVGLATGITEVPAGFNNDTFNARLSSKERVLSGPQNEDLKKFIFDSRGLSSKLDTLIDVMSLQRNTVVNVGGRELVNAIQDEINSGRSLAV